MKRAFFFILAAVVAAASPAAAEEVVFETNHGEMIFFIDADAAPATAENFLQYARDGFFDGTIFHRVIPGFVIQGGGFTIPAGEGAAAMVQKPTREPIQNEAANGVKNKRYSLSMARTADPHSATSQFFINLQDNASLDYDPGAGNAGYAVFGFVSEGHAVVDAIAAVQTTAFGPFRDVPAAPVIVSAARVLEE